MKKLNFNITFFKDVLFNELVHFKCLFFSKIAFCLGVSLNAFSFIISTFTGLPFFYNLYESLRLFNLVIITCILAIRHRVNINDFNIAKELSRMDSENDLVADIQKIEIVPKNFMLYDDMPLTLLKKVYKEGAYILITTRVSEYTFYVQKGDVYLVDDLDTLSEVKTLKLSREII